MASRRCQSSSIQGINLVSREGRKKKNSCVDLQLRQTSALDTQSSRCSREQLNSPNFSGTSTSFRPADLLPASQSFSACMREKCQEKTKEKKNEKNMILVSKGCAKCVPFNIKYICLIMFFSKILEHCSPVDLI